MAVAVSIRREKYAAYRRYRRLYGENSFWHYPAGSPLRIACVEATKQLDATWDACKRAAIEIAAGI